MELYLNTIKVIRDSYDSQLFRCFSFPNTKIGIITPRDNITPITAELHTKYPTVMMQIQSGHKQLVKHPKS